ncbi:SCO3242 family prenyltransferase [Kitasatospora sp. NPDC091335]|uniref:SCO3242 family prenyltransferase n=1 Tax=Kitasatospora sp. NPDC091335 TaxID=3364085 RepID=UPI00382757F2
MRSGPDERKLLAAARRLRPVAQLLRAPAALTVPGDVLAGTLAAGQPLRPRTALAAASSVCLYWAGMALNDWKDRETDALERPERPIPSGEVSPGTALALAIGLTAAGIGLGSKAGGRRGLVSATILASAVWSYDLVLKSTPFGPLSMAGARGLNVLSGAASSSGSMRATVPAIAAVAVHTAVVTQLSRHEVDADPGVLPVAAIGVSGAICAGLTAGVRRAPQMDKAVTTTLAGLYFAGFGRALVAVSRDPSAKRVRHAVAAGIHGLMPLQAALASRAGGPAIAGLIALGYPLVRGLGRRVSPT